MPSCKQKIHASPDQVFNYLSDLQNVVDLFKDKVSIKTIKDLGSACYGKQYRYEIEKTPGVMQGMDVEITEYEPFKSIFEFFYFLIKFNF
jgi:hypothetical protein